MVGVFTLWYTRVCSTLCTPCGIPGYVAPYVHPGYTMEGYMPPYVPRVYHGGLYAFLCTQGIPWWLYASLCVPPVPPWVYPTLPPYLGVPVPPYTVCQLPVVRALGSER